MLNEFERKLKPIKLLAFISTLLFSILANAQPGWEDFTARYFYTVIDNKGKEISFQRNKRYQIMVDSVLYQSRNIPQDTIKHISERGFDYNEGYLFQIRINDFSLVIPQKNYSNSGKNPEIKIIHKKDTMYICQPSGQGSTMMEWKEINGANLGNKASPPSDFTLRFIPGHYYFPNWAKSLLDNLAQTIGNVKIRNVKQDNFIVPKNIYDSLNPNFYRYKSRRILNADEYIINNFMKGNFSVEKRMEATKFDQSVLPYKNPRWNTQLYPTKDPNRFYGMIGYSADFYRCSSFKDFFSILNKKENTIEQFFPKDNPRLFGGSKLYVDSFNDILYLPVFTKKEFDFSLSDCEDTTLIKKITYRSDDEGNSWKKDEHFQQLFDKYEFRKYEFLDKEHTLGYKREKTGLKVNKTEIVQGTYYLLKNRQVIDSLKTPEDIYYNSNDNNYRFEIKNDSVFLGSWSYGDFRNYGNPYFQPFMTKVDGQWNFQVEEKIWSRTVPTVSIETDSKKEYQNFTLINKRELVFNNGAGTLRMKEDVVAKDSEKSGGYYVLEKEKEIYLISFGFEGYIYFSFDAGTSWFVYPLPLVGNYRYSLLNIDEKGIISHFSNEWEGGEGRIIKKVFHQFSPE